MITVVISQAFVELYQEEKWVLGLLVPGSLSEHKRLVDMFFAALQGLKEMIPDPTVRGTICKWEGM